MALYGKILEEFGQRREAREIYLKLLQVDPTHADAVAAVKRLTP